MRRRNSVAREHGGHARPLLLEPPASSPARAGPTCRCTSCSRSRSRGSERLERPHEPGGDPDRSSPRGSPARATSSPTAAATARARPAAFASRPARIIPCALAVLVAGRNRGDRDRALGHLAGRLAGVARAGRGNFQARQPLSCRLCGVAGGDAAADLAEIDRDHPVVGRIVACRRCGRGRPRAHAPPPARRGFRDRPVSRR